MANANELLASIFQVLTKIDSKLTAMGGPTGPQASVVKGLSFNLNDLESPKETAKNINDLADAIKSLSSGLWKFWLVPKAAKTSLIDFMKALSINGPKSGAGVQIISSANEITNLSLALNKLTANPKKIEDTAKALSTLFKEITTFGKNEKTIKNITNMSESLSKSLKDVDKVTKRMGILFLGIGGAILAIATALWVSGKMLGSIGPLAVLGVLALTVVTLTGIFYLLSKAGDSVKKGAETGKEMGKALMYISGGVLAFVASWQIITGIMGVGFNLKGLAVAAATIVGVLTLFAGAFWILGKFEKNIKDGSTAAKSMGVGLVFLAGGMLAIIGIMYLFSKLDNPLKSFIMMGLVIGALVGIFYLMGKYWKQILIGTAVSIAFSLGVYILSLALKPVMNIAAMIEKMKNPGKTFLTLGLVMAGLIGIFALLGQPEVAMFVALGAAVVAAMVIPFTLIGVTLNQFAKSTKTFMETASQYDITKIKPTVHTMITGVLGGFIDAFTETLTGGKKGWRAFPEAVKNTAVIMTGIGLLMGVSVALSQFARAISAFADLNNMRVIEGTDKNGKPIFGEKVDVAAVGRNVTTTISTFLSGLLNATEDLTKKKAAAIKKMGRALTGRRGILSAVIGFADAIKTYAEFGNGNTIAGVELVDTGKKDADGYPIYTEKKTVVSVNNVVQNMVKSFTTFIDKLAEHTESFYKLAQDRSVKKIARALTGKRGVLSAVIGFSEALQMYAKYGEKNEVPIFNDKGEQIGTLKMEQVAENIVKSLSTFSDILADALDKDDKKNARQAKRTLNRFDDLIEQFNKLAKAQEGLEKITSTIGALAQNIGLLATNLNTFDSNRLATIAAASKGNTSIVESGNVIADKANKISSNSTKNVYNYNTTNNLAKPEETKTKEPNWDEIANKIGIQVGNQLANAIRNGQIRFEFSHDKSGVMTIG